jgi:polysaccharide biosynthesis/export protein
MVLPKQTPFSNRTLAIRVALYLLVVLAGVGSLGCHSVTPEPHGDGNPLPQEQQKVILPDYVIEPPDILLIDALRVVPLPPYKAAPLDTLLITVQNAPPPDTISGLYPIETEGTINLGPSYGSINVVGMSIEQITKAIEKQLEGILKVPPKVAVSLAQTRGTQQIRGEHLVRPDGTIGLGLFGK